MSLFSYETHADNPPETWVVVKVHDKLWQLQTKDGSVITSEKTKKKAEAHKTGGFYFDLYNDETRWYRGERVRNWKLFTPPAASTSNP